MTLHSSPTMASEKCITVVHCWSAPRSRSTALCYSFEARVNTVVLDEPLYVDWLREQGDLVKRPYLPNLLQGIPVVVKGSDETNDSKWKRELLTLEERIHQAATALSDGGVIFCKQMAKFGDVYNFSKELSSTSAARETTSTVEGYSAPVLDYKLTHRHVLLIRDPVAVLSSWGAAGDVHGNNPTIHEVGIVPLLSIYSTLQSSHQSLSATAVSTGNNGIVVLDSDELVDDPAGVLTSLCEQLGVEYQDSMMTWSSGPHECDGPWADWWYADVRKSTGWNVPISSDGNDDGENRPARRYRSVNPGYIAALSASYPAYEYLQRLTRRHQTRAVADVSLVLPAKKLYEDPRNEHILVYLGAPNRGRIVPRDMAGVSPFDSSVQGGDAAWEGLRVYRGKILSLDKHLNRLFKSAKALGFEQVHTRQQIKEAIFQVLAANGMRDGAHMRLTLTRGEKCTSSMNPIFNVYGTTLIILPEWKPTEGATTYDNAAGIALITASQRRNPPQTVDSKIHHNNLINNILPKIQANLAGCADAIMLDVEGYVSETNATNIFMVDEDGTLLTPSADHCLPGITRATVLSLASELGIPTEVRRISLSEFHAAEEVFTTGTMGELTPVVLIDGRVIGTGRRGPVTAQLQATYQTLPERDGWATPLPPFDEGT